ncbi:MAG: hypothetical protein WCP33_00955 [Deltaproteobacteria bacterium]
MANEAATLKIPEDIEYRVLGNAFGLMIATGGLLAGAMVSERSFDYWLNDIVPLLLFVFMSFRLFRNLMSTMMLYYRYEPQHVPSHKPRAESLNAEPLHMPQIAAPNGPTPEQVVEEVVKRIEAQKAEQAKKNQAHN